MNPASVTDAQIDRLVYDLYGMTDHEIQIVAGTSAFIFLPSNIPSSD